MRLSLALRASISLSFSLSVSFKLAPLRVKPLYAFSSSVFCSGVSPLNPWSNTSFTLANKPAFMAISLPCADKRGLISCAISCISSLVSALFKLKKAEVTLVSSSPLFSNATITFSNVGVSLV